MKSAQYWRSKYVAECTDHKLTREREKRWRGEWTKALRGLMRQRRRLRAFAEKF